MSNLDPRDSDESPYEYDEPKKPLSPRRLANYTLVATGAVASVAFGLQVVGPAVASAMYPSTIQVESANRSPDSQTSNPAQPGVLGIAAANLGLTSASLFGGTPVSVAPSSAASQIQLPAGSPSFGNLSSATPSGGSMAAWGSGEDDDDRDEDDDREDDDREDDDD